MLQVTDRERVTRFLEAYRKLCKEHGIEFVVDCTHDYDRDPYDPPATAQIHIRDVDTNELLVRNHEVRICEYEGMGSIEPLD